MKDNLKSICANIIGNDNRNINAAIYVDYENVLMRLREYNLHPVNDLDFFRVFAEKIKDLGISVVKYIAYANFDDFGFKKTAQSQLQSFGVDTVHTSRIGKSSSDIDLIVDALYDLYKKPSIQLFIIVSNDRDYIPLLKAIKLENKTTLLISTKNGFNDTARIFACYHEFIENIFNLKSLGYSLSSGHIGDKTNITITPDVERQAVKVTSLLHSSALWKNYLYDKSSPVSLAGYADLISKNVITDSDSKEIETYFYAAQKLGLVKMFISDHNGQVYFE